MSNIESINWDEMFGKVDYESIYSMVEELSPTIFQPPHDTLNPKIWDGIRLKPTVRDALLQVVSQYIEDSSILNMSNVLDIEIVGSNANFNYNPGSDIDLHIIVNMETVSPDIDVVQAACNAEKALFNKNYDIIIKGLEVELYVEDVRMSATSNGVFSISENKWIKFPVKTVVPNMWDNNGFVTAVEVWYDEALELSKTGGLEKIKNYIDRLYMFRKNSLIADGEYSVGNAVFKYIRSAGLLDELKDKVKQLQSKELSLESLK